MDSAFPTAPYPGYTTAELEAAVAAGRGNPVMLGELERRRAVAAGDRSQMTAGERLRAVRDELDNPAIELAIDDATQFATAYRDGRPIASVQRRRVLERGPAFKVYDLAGAKLFDVFAYGADPARHIARKLARLGF